MKIMIAYDHSRNARIAIDWVKRMFGELKPSITVISVIEDPQSATSAADDFFQQQYQDQKSGTEQAAQQLSAAGFTTSILIAEGDARKLILRATQERAPDMLVIARHSYKSDGNFITRRLDALVQEFDHMTFGSVSAFLARRVQCPLLIVPTHEEDLAE